MDFRKKINIYINAFRYIISKYNFNKIFFNRTKLPIHIINNKPLSLKVFNQIYEEGISKLKLSDFISKQDIKSLFEEVKRLSNKKGLKFEKKYLKNYLGGDYLQRNKLIFKSNDPILKIALHPFILSVVNKYINENSNLVDVNISESFPLKSTNRIQSQRWHRDPVVRSVIKIFIYLSDVSEKNGPFEYIKRTHHQQKLNPINGPISPKRFGGSFYPEDISLNEYLKKDNLKSYSFCGLAGTVLISDTSGLHRGGYSGEGSRLMLTLTYYPRRGPNQSRIKVIDKNNYLTEFQKANI